MAHQAHLAYHEKMYSSPLVPPPSFKSLSGPIRENPYATRYDDFLRDVEEFGIIDTTLCEGEESPLPPLTSEAKLRIARLLDQLGVEEIELPSPALSDQAAEDLRAICALDLRAKVVARIGPDVEEVKQAAECGAWGVNILLPESSLPSHSIPEQDLELLINSVEQVITLARSLSLSGTLTFSNAYTISLVSLLKLARAAFAAGTEKIGLLDSTGVQTPLRVYEFVRTVTGAMEGAVEVGFGNSTACATANACTALEAHATHIRCSVLGLGPGVGIVPLGGFLTSLAAANRELISQKYDLSVLREVEELVAREKGVELPWCAPGTGWAAWRHTAGEKHWATLEGGRREVLRGEDWVRVI